MKNVMMILATVLIFTAACGSPKQVEEVEQPEEIEQVEEQPGNGGPGSDFTPEQLIALTGPTGAKGDVGETGPKGDKGDTGTKGDKGDTGATGATGASGQGVPSGGTIGQILAKKSATDYDTEWEDAPSGGSGSASDIVLSDTYANRPAAGTAGRLFLPTDRGIICRDNGTAWENFSNGSSNRIYRPNGADLGYDDECKRCWRQPKSKQCVCVHKRYSV